MKKMYKKPITEDVEIVANSIVCVSTEGGGNISDIIADAPGRHRNTLIVK